MATFHIKCVHKESGAEYFVPMNADSKDLAVERAVDEGHLVAADQSARTAKTTRSEVRGGMLDTVKIIVLGIVLLWVGWQLLEMLINKLY